MTWGVPPKFELKKRFNGIAHENLHDKTAAALEHCGFVIIEDSKYHISIEKKMKMSFLSLFTFSRAYMRGIVLIPETGEVTVKSKYDYRDTRTSGGLINDLGRQKKEIEALMKTIDELN